MRDVRIADLAGRQFNRISLAQLQELGLSESAIVHRVANGRLLAVEQGVFAVAPVLDDDWGRWMAATLTAPRTELSHASAAAAWGFWSLPRAFETVTRPGSGGPRRHGGILAFRSQTLDRRCTVHRGVPITTVPRTILDLASGTSDRALARAVREAIRIKVTTLAALTESTLEHRGRRGVARLTNILARYSGLPLARARSGAEVRALEILRDAGWPMPRLNQRIAGEEADLSWRQWRLVIEIDGGPFHLDVGEDARKEAIWRAAGWTVRRIPSDDIYERPTRLFALAPPPNVPAPPPQQRIRDARRVGERRVGGIGQTWASPEGWQSG